MTDSRLQQLKRAWEASGSVQDEAAWLRERVRVGELTQERLELAAYCGHEGAVRIGSPDPPGLLNRWLAGLVEWGNEAAVVGLAVYLRETSHSRHVPNLLIRFYEHVAVSVWRGVSPELPVELSDLHWCFMGEGQLMTEALRLLESSEEGPAAFLSECFDQPMLPVADVDVHEIKRQIAHCALTGSFDSYSAVWIAE